MGVAGVRRSGGEGRWLRGAEKRGRDTEQRIGQSKEKREKTGYWRGVGGGGEGENFKEGEEGSGKRNERVKLQEKKRRDKSIYSET